MHAAGKGGNGSLACAVVAGNASLCVFQFSLTAGEQEFLHGREERRRRSEPVCSMPAQPAGSAYNKWGMKSRKEKFMGMAQKAAGSRRHTAAGERGIAHIIVVAMGNGSAMLSTSTTNGHHPPPGQWHVTLFGPQAHKGSHAMSPAHKASHAACQALRVLSVGVPAQRFARGAWRQRRRNVATGWRW